MVQSIHKIHRFYFTDWVLIFKSNSTLLNFGQFTNIPLLIPIRIYRPTYSYVYSPQNIIKYIYNKVIVPRS